MRFRIFGDGDCPDWVLVQINTLARLTSVKMYQLSNLVAESIAQDTPIDFEKAKELTANAKFDKEEVKASISSLGFLLSSATKYNVLETTLDQELLQLGLPREHVRTLVRVFRERLPELAAGCTRKSLRTSRLVDSSLERHGTHSTLSLTYWSAATNKTHTNVVTVTNDKLVLMLHDLKLCSEKLQSLENEMD